jgi:putative (di)nucleoside polyphosphate hydrolase
MNLFLYLVYKTPVKSSMRYRLGVGIVLINQEGLILTAERSDIAMAWQMPQGGIEKNETAETAMWRELEEEVGLTRSHAKILGTYPDWLSYEFKKDKGQVQKWFYLQFTGKDKDLQLGFEFLRWRWTTPSCLLNEIVDFKRLMYEKIMAHLPDAKR